jgi:Na+/melibiose symporter-like transporter
MGQGGSVGTSIDRGSNKIAICYGVAHGGKTLLWGFVDSFFVFFCIYALNLTPLTATFIATGFFVFEALLQPLVAAAIQRFYLRHRSMAVWVRWSVLLTCCLFPCLFWPWSFEFQPLIVAAMIVVGVGFHTAFTCIDVPLNASIGRFEPDSRNRTGVSAIRNLAGTLARFSLALMTALWLEPEATLDIGRFPWAATGVAAIAGVLIILGFEIVDAKARTLDPIKSELPPPSSKIALRHILTPNLLLLMGVNIVFLASMTQFDRALIYIIGTDSRSGVLGNLQPETKFSHIWLIMSGFGALAGFFWLGLAARFEKSHVAIFCVSAFALTVIGFLWLPLGPMWFMGFVITLAVTGTINPLIWAMLPDVMDEVSLRVGYPVQPTVAGIFTLAGKLSIGAAQLISGCLLEINGFPSNPTISNYTQSVVWVCVIGAVLAGAALLFYRLTHDAHGAIIKSIWAESR